MKRQIVFLIMVATFLPLTGQWDADVIAGTAHARCLRVGGNQYRDHAEYLYLPVKPLARHNL
jgi:hypothetical protein